jgi:predicted DCC family thiol-disulfide oxidoreductase YuxK
MTPISQAPPDLYRVCVFYDADCDFCRAGVAEYSRLFLRHGVRFQPLQTRGAAARLGISETELRREMRLLYADGHVLGGVDAWSALLRTVWWLWPLGTVLRIPGIHWLATRVYRWIAAHRYHLSTSCAKGSCPINERKETQNA